MREAASPRARARLGTLLDARVVRPAHALSLASLAATPPPLTVRRLARPAAPPCCPTRPAAPPSRRPLGRYQIEYAV